MLRASDFIRKGAYPADEKRPPLFPAILALRPNAVDAVQWGRGVMLVVSVAYFLVFSAFAELFIKDKRFLMLAKLLFIFNPVILYWSLRIMSDVPFALLVLLIFYCLHVWSKNLDLGKLILLGFMSGLSVLLRFEGYLVIGALIAGIFFLDQAVNFRMLKPKGLFEQFKRNFWHIFIYLITTVLTILPFILFRNPFDSSYLGEPSGRAYDIKTAWVYIVSLAFLFGFVPAFFIVLTKFRSFFSVYTRSFGILFFLLEELVLILLWPAALPRLFISVIPFLIIPLVILIKTYTGEKPLNRILFLIINLCVLAFFAGSQYVLKLQFLVPGKINFLVILAIQLFVIFSFYKKSYVLTSVAIFVSVVFWSFSTIWLHKDIYSAIKQAAYYTTQNLSGTVAFNDTTSVFDWYVNFSKPRTDLKAFYYTGKVEKGLLDASHIDYLVVTNEDNIGVQYKIKGNAYLTLVKDFRYNISRKEFYAQIYKVEGNK